MCDPGRLPFVTTRELSPVDGIAGQVRATAAAQFGIAIKARGYNLFVVGPPATGKASTMRELLTRAASAEPTPPEHCYVHNFADAYRPRVLTLPAGRGRALQDAMAHAVAEVRPRLTRALEGEELTRRRKTGVEDLQRREQANVHRLEEAARRAGFAVVSVDNGVEVRPAPEGKPLSPSDVEQLPAETRERIATGERALDAEVAPLVREMRALGREAARLEHQLIEEAAATVGRQLFADVREAFADVSGVGTWLDAVEKDLAAHAGIFLREDEGEEESESGAEQDDESESLLLADAGGESALLESYRVNLLVDREGVRGAPVVVEERPRYGNLIGRIEHRIQLGTLTTDFMLVQAGALHRANGGYLLLEARDLIAEPFAWSALKGALKSGAIRIEEPSDELRLPSAESLQPEPIPLALKVVLLGTPELYQTLYELDPELAELFKVKVEFDGSLPRTAETELMLARVVAGAAREVGLPALAAGAVARRVEQSARAVPAGRRLSARFGDLLDLVREASVVAALRGATLVEADDVQSAVAQRRRRTSLIEDELSREVDEGEYVIDTDGEAIGQVNGLEVLDFGDHRFGRPLRITARARPGKPGVVDVEREAGLGGSLHTKGVLILGGYLGGRYATDRPLAMTASIVAEQSYGPLDGDSASCAEVCALLSTLAGAPLSQSLAVTGSVDQRGAVQAVGGINEKIEGFFDLCRRRGLTGRQGVLIPTASVQQLMLREEVVEAARSNRFRVVPIASVDEAMACLTGRDAGERGAGGRFPVGSINAAVEDRVIAFARSVARRGE